MAYELSCADVGAGSCKGAFVGATEDELIAQVAAHLKADHAVHTVSQTLVNLVRATARQS